jgi:type IV pilus assembly protein PilP
MMQRRLMALLLGGALLSACSDSDVREVKEWMEKTKAETKPTVQALSEPKTFVPFPYTARDMTDPFTPNKLLAELARAAEQKDSPNRPDMNRRKEPLEAFPLDTMSMVGVIQKAGVTYALVQIDKQLHQVRVGQYLGQNFGKVTSVTEDAVTLREVVQDAAGDWVERISKLELLESKEIRK